MGRPKGAGGNIVLGLRIVQLRRCKGLSQKQLGDAVGVSYQQIQKYEQGINRIASDRLKGIAAALGEKRRGKRTRLKG
ncbi:helix-turn-helix transcriptional regulator [Methylobacterium sp. Leaf456]|uniref:helix-turn-helix domain-containing protein n=1 Tax=Methylobacterium sp. Leaf456 TaxID=1736382 RepID=UPI000AFC9470|nr:helix-turn-helix transcriptional regulator [Methylobacterium sp. Leaf456]